MRRSAYGAAARKRTRKARPYGEDGRAGISRFPGDLQVDKGWIVDYNK